MDIVLGSSSPYRAKLLSQLGIEAIQISPKIDESPQKNEPAEQLVQRLAKEKALAVDQKLRKKQSPALIIASDQTAEFDGTILGKPLTSDNAVNQLLSMSGQSVQFFTSLVILNSQTHDTFERVDLTEVNFRELNRSDVENYVQREQPLDCAGSFKCEGLGISLFESIKTEDPSALIGLPLISLNHGLLKFGVNILDLDSLS